MSNHSLVTTMHKKFGLHYPKAGPRTLDKEELTFRVTAMFEELFEYIESAYEVTPDYQDDMMGLIKQQISSFQLKRDPDLSDQFDALLDLAVFTIGTADRQNLPWDDGFERVMEANIAKELGANGDKRGGFKRDLVKPEGWEAPVLDDLIMDQSRIAAGHKHTSHKEDQLSPDALCGLIVLDGPDCAGKTTLANVIAEEYDGIVVHRTWSKALEKKMDQYLMDPINVFQKGDLMIIDRNFLSEWIYSKVYRSGTYWNGFHRLALEKLKSLNAMHILCVPNNKEIWMARLEKEMNEGREEMYSFDKRQCEIYDFYKSIVSSDGDLSCISEGLHLGKYFHYDMQITDVEEFVGTELPSLLKGANKNVSI